jgi:hypothetical protein
LDISAKGYADWHGKFEAKSGEIMPFTVKLTPLPKARSQPSTAQ